MNLRIGLTLLLLVAALVSAWSLWNTRSDDGQAAPSSARSDYLLRDFQLTALDKEGKESFSLQAPLLQETPGKKTMDMTQPRFQIPDKQGKYWNVRSRTGWVSEGNDEIRLRGEVVTTSPQGAPNPTTMNTEQLNVFPDTNRLTSADVVTITQPGLTMRGRGLDADLSARRFTLQSQARTRYVSTRR